ncbi:unnamed protein product [Onchocerca flexuosa]|uniref:Uncharacterized protein n=1 Tax=Onchocerca flexuosa TaxID=387005 RepID=A0A183HVG6_9BILA|nr:unnamed protein product [Onchocerca flexuosa]
MSASVSTAVSTRVFYQHILQRTPAIIDSNRHNNQQTGTRIFLFCEQQRKETQ